jgi:uncharacterized phage-like protein YoqJ
MNLAVTGHRPPKIGGYNENSPLRTAVRRAIRSRIRELKPDYGITGMALGVDQDFAKICIELDIPFIAAIPFKGQESAWPEASQAEYQNILAKAHAKETICLGGFAGWKMQKRNEWMVHQADHILAVWDGSSGGTANCVAFANEKSVPITRINPKEL